MNAYLAALGENIAFTRGERGMKAVDLARALGVTKQAVSMWESGKAAPTLAHLRGIAAICGVTIGFLVDVTVEDAAA